MSPASTCSRRGCAAGSSAHTAGAEAGEAGGTAGEPVAALHTCTPPSGAGLRTHHYSYAETVSYVKAGDSVGSLCSHLASSKGEAAGCRYSGAGGRCVVPYGGNVRRCSNVGNAAHCRLPSSQATHTQRSLELLMSSPSKKHIF